MPKHLHGDGEFKSAKAKVSRARIHINDAENLIDQLRSNFGTSIVKKTTKTGIEFKIVEGERIETFELSAIVGDAIHNLRSALDQSISELARLNGKSDSNVYFPFSGTEDDLDTMIQRKKAHLAGPSAIKIIKSLKPYKGGNVLLRAIHDYDIEDKHKNLVHVSQATKTPSMGIGRDADTDGTTYQCSVSFNFPTFGPLDGKDIIETLKSMVELVERILEIFELSISH